MDSDTSVVMRGFVAECGPKLCNLGLGLARHRNSPLLAAHPMPKHRHGYSSCNTTDYPRPCTALVRLYKGGLLIPASPLSPFALVGHAHRKALVQ
eukprot:356034-Chlamydomonas_euryale.AAC.5